MSHEKCISGILFRLAMFSLAICYWAISEYDHRALAGQFARLHAGAFLCAMTGLLGFLGIVDILINDILPERFTWKSGHDFRHFTILGLAFCYMAQLYVSLASFPALGIALFSGWNALALVSLALMDARLRQKGGSHALTPFN